MRAKGREQPVGYKKPGCGRCGVAQVAAATQETPRGCSGGGSSVQSLQRKEASFIGVGNLPNTCSCRARCLITYLVAQTESYGLRLRSSTDSRPTHCRAGALRPWEMRSAEQTYSYRVLYGSEEELGGSHYKRHKGWAGSCLCGGSCHSTRIPSHRSRFESEDGGDRKTA